MAERNMDVYARILSRVEPQELQEQYHRVVRRDVKRTLSNFTQLQDALQRLHEVDTATRRLLTPAPADRNSSKMLAQLNDILALRQRLTSALDTLMHAPPSVSDRMKLDIGLDKQRSGLHDIALSEDADKSQQFVKKRKLISSGFEVLLPLPVADKWTLGIKQEDVTATTTMAMKANPHWDDARPITRKRYSTPTIDLSNESDDKSLPAQLELNLLGSESDAAKPPTCLEDAQKLWRSSSAAQSHQFPFLITKLRNHLYTRATRLDLNEAQEIAQAIEIATAIGMNPDSVQPNDPALTDLLVAIGQFRALGAGDIPVHFTKIANKFTAYLLLTATAAAASVALGDPYIVQHGEGTVIRVDV